MAKVKSASPSGPFYQDFTESRPGSHRRWEPRAATLRQRPPRVWQLVEPTTHGRASSQRAAVPTLHMKHSDTEMPPRKSTQPRGAHGEQGQRKPKAITLQKSGRHLPGRGKAGRQCNPGGGKALTRPPQGKPPSTSSSAESDQQDADHLSMASPPWGRSRRGSTPSPYHGHRSRSQCIESDCRFMYPKNATLTASQASTAQLHGARKPKTDLLTREQ